MKAPLGQKRIVHLLYTTDHTIDDHSITIVDKEGNKNRRLRLRRSLDDLTRHTGTQRTEWQMVTPIIENDISVHCEQT